MSLQTQGLVGSICTLSGLSLAAVLLRVLAARKKKRGLKVHDHFIIASLLFMIVCLALMLTPIWLHCDIFFVDGQPHCSEEAIATTLKTNFADTFMWYISAALFRLAILNFYYEMFGRGNNSFRYYNYGSAVLVLMAWIVSTLTSLLGCRPISRNWNPDSTGVCHAPIFVKLFPIAFGMVIDTWVAFLPMPIILKLRLPLHKKIGVLAIFAMGLFLTGINLARLVNAVILLGVTNVKWSFSGVAVDMILAVAEMSFGIIVACIPMLGVIIFPQRKGIAPPMHDINVPATIGTKPVKLRENDLTLNNSLIDESNNAMESV